MSIKNLLVAYNGTEATNAALTAAMRIAENYDAHLTGVLAHGGVPIHASASPWITEEIRERISRSARDVRAGIAKSFEDRVADFSRRENIHWLDVSGAADASIMRCARYFDLVVMGQNRDEMQNEQSLALHPELIAQRSGKPVLIVPAGYEAKSENQTAVVGWDGRRASARALADAMQIIENGWHVRVVSVGETVSQDEETLSVMTHLERHGLNADRVFLDRSGSIGDTILGYCKKSGAGMLVMGAYEHSKFNEDILGGVTNHILRNAPLPVLMSH